MTEKVASFAEVKTASGLHVITQNPMSMTLAEAFPVADSMVVPLGNKVVVQLRSPKTKVGRIALTKDTQDQEKFNTAVGRIVALGSIAYHRRDTGEAWPEGVWVAVGDYVRVPKFGGDRWDVFVDPSDDRTDDTVARFALYNDYEIFSKIVGDPMNFRDYI